MKQFTSVLFGLVLVLVFYTEISYSQEKTREMCIKENNCSQFLNSSGNEYTNCTSQCSDYRTSQQIAQDTKAENKETKQICSDAMKEYSKATKQNPCGSSGATKACYDQIASCQASTGVNGAQPLATGDENIDSLANSALQMISASQAAKQNSATAFEPNLACYSALKIGDKDAAKERKSRRDQIIKDIEAADKERREANEKLAKETNETKVEQQKLQAETTKTLQKLDVEKREKLTKMNEELQKAGTDIRKQTTEIIKIKQAMEKMKFENQKTMVNYTDEKINIQCKQALVTAKACLVQSTKSKAALDESCKDIYKVVGTVTGKGIKGTADLKNKLTQVKEACFEQSNQAASTLKYDYADKVRTYEMDIKEKQEQIADSNKALEAKKTENEAISKETDAQKSQEQKSLEEQMANFAEKLSDLQKSTDAAVKSSEEKIALLNTELKDLKAGALASETADPGSQSIYNNVANEAYGQLGEISAATSSAFGACCSIPNPKAKVNKTTNAITAKLGSGATDASCSTLYQQSTDAEKRTTEKSNNGSIR